MFVAFHSWVESNVDPFVAASRQRQRVVRIVGMRDDAGQRDPVVLEDRFELEDVGRDVIAVKIINLMALHHRAAFFPRELWRPVARGMNLIFYEREADWGYDDNIV